ALGSLLIEESKSNLLKRDIEKILSKYDKELGINKELKSTAKYKFKNKLLQDIIDTLLKYKVRFYFDISNKKYKIVMNIVEYCIYPYYLQDTGFSEELRQKKIFAANYLFYNLNDNILNKFIDLCTQNLEENEVVSHSNLLDFLQVLYNNIIDEHIKYQVKFLKDYICNYRKYGLSIRNIYPIQDLTNKKSLMSFLPNIDAFLNIIANTTNLRMWKEDKLLIFHDEQKQFSESLVKWVEEMKHKMLVRNIDKIAFVESKTNVLIQTIDFLTGTILSCLVKSINNPYIRSNREMLRILKPMVENCNIVSVEGDYREFFKQSKVKFSKSPVPF
ncbi:hypothetical protein, partial [Clostridium novyi]